MGTNKIIISKEESLVCKGCNTKCYSHINLLFHIKSNHNIENFEKYIIVCYFNNVYPKCKCGCGIKLKFKSLICGPWFRDYTKNHFPRKPHSLESKKKIAETYKRNCTEKYGVNNIFQVKLTKDKIRDIKFKRYGNPNYNNSEKNKQTQHINYDRI